MAAGPGHRPYGEGFPATRQPDPHFARVTPNLDHSIEGDIVEKLSFLAVTVTDETDDRPWHGTGNPPGQVLDIPGDDRTRMVARSEEHTSELQSLMRISYAVFCLQKK